MKVTRKKLESAVADQILSADQAEKLYRFLERYPDPEPSFSLTHILYYLGGMVAIGAMTLFMNLGWQSFGGWGIFFISLAYAGVGFKLTELFRNKAYTIPAGICATFVVALTPLAVYGLQQGLGIWPDDSVYREYHQYVRWHWIYMELATLAVGVIIAWKYQSPFSIMPIAVTLWYLSMDIAVMITGIKPDLEFRAMGSMYFGCLMIALAFWVDVRSRKTFDYAFWLYIFGVLTFWGGMTSQDSGSEINKFIYFCINLLMIGIGAALVRRVFVIFGAIGCAMYVGYLASEVFENEWFFAFSLTAIGLIIIYCGVLWEKNERHITAKARSVLPLALRELLESREK